MKVFRQKTALQRRPETGTSKDSSMPRFGAHISTAGDGSASGLALAIDRAVELKCQTMQIFLGPPARWQGSPLTSRDVSAFRSKSAEANIFPILAHSIYLINLASPVDSLYEKSRAAFLDELTRTDALGMDFLVVHPGTHKGAGESAGLKRIADALSWASRKRPKGKAQILLETTAGQGTALCSRFEHLAYLLENVNGGRRLGVCLDTCHMFVAGYDIKSRKGYQDTMNEFDALVGIEHIRAIHVNDSKGALGSHLDRHENIGKGRLGTKAFGRIVRDARFADLPMILETPKTDSRNKPMDPVNLRRLRRLARQRK